MTWCVYSGATQDGNFTLVDSAAVTFDAATAVGGWHASPDFDLPLAEGMYYGLLAHFGAADVTYYNNNSTAELPQATGWGQQVGPAWDDTSPTPPAIDTLVPLSGAASLHYAQRVNTSAELDGAPYCADCDDSDDTLNSLDTDNDTVDTCSGDCDDNEPLAFPGNTETWYDGIDGDCDGHSDYDADSDGFDSGLYGGADCDDTTSLVWPYAWEDMSDGIDNDCDGGVDGADADVVTLLALNDDSSVEQSLSGWTFPFCGTDWSTFRVVSNGRLNFGFDDNDSSESAAEFEGDGVSIAALWDDFYPEGGNSEIVTIDHGSAFGVYFNDVEGCCTNTPPGDTFAAVIEDTGRIFLSYGSLEQTDGLVGWSCGLDTGVASVDISAQPSNGSLDGSIGTGTEDALYELFPTGSNDMEASFHVYCGTQGVDGDNDGWTDLCGDPDDSDPSATP